MNGSAVLTLTGVTGNKTNNFAGVIINSGQITTASSSPNVLGGTTAFLSVNGAILSLGSGATDTNGTLNNNYIGNVNMGNGTITGNALYMTNLIVTNTGTALISSRINGTGVITKNGAGTLTLSASNSFTGRTVVNNGQLSVSNAFALGSTNNSLDLRGGTLYLGSYNITSGSVSFGDGNLSGTGTLNAASYSATNSAAVTISNSLTGTGGFAKSGGVGTLTLSGSNSYTGSTVVSSGTLLVTNSAANDFVIGNSNGESTNLVVNGGTLISSAGSVIGNEVTSVRLRGRLVFVDSSR